MIVSLTGGTVVKGLLLDRHVAVSNMGKFRENSLEIGRTLDYDYYIGLCVRPSYNISEIFVHDQGNIIF